MQESANISHDFDFGVGQWEVKHRRLKERLVGCDEWEEFSGRSETRLVLGGNGNVEDNLLEIPGGHYRAIAVRSFDTVSQNWAIWWLAANDPHQLDVPVIGKFEDGAGSFFANDTLNGENILVRFLWLRTDTPSPRWEQAMSRDDGISWETNWTMDFVRV